MSTKVKVLFKRELRGVLAVFPDIPSGFNGYRHDLVTCYSHVGQHSSCAPEYYKKLPNAEPEEYKDLKDELLAIGYTFSNHQ